MAKPIPVQELKEVKDLTKQLDGLTSKVGKNFDDLRLTVMDVSSELNNSLDLQKSSRKNAKDLAKGYGSILNFIGKQNVGSRIGLGFARMRVRLSRNLTDEQKKQILALGDETKEQVKGNNFAEKLKNKLKENVTVQKSVNLALVGATALFGALIGIGTKFAGMIDSIGQSFGSLSVMGEPFKNDLLDASVEATKLGGGMADVSAITSTLASNFGMNVNEAAKLSSKVFDTSKAIGLSVDEGANLFGVLTQTANLSADQAEKLAEGAFQLARQAGVAPNAVLKDIAGSAEEIAGFTKDGGDNIAEAAVQARQMGLSLGTTAKIAKGLLDFESSISNELEASIMIGKQLNFQKARQLALDGDIAGATKNIVAQLGSEADFNALNVLQRESLAKSIGVSVTELSKLVSGTEKLTLAGSLAAGSFDDLTGQEALSNLSSITGEFKSLLSEALVAIGPEIEKLIGGFRTFLKESGGVAYLKETFLGVVDVVKSLISSLPTIIALFGTLKLAAIGLSLAQSMAALTKGGMAMGPIGIGLTLAALTGAFLHMKSLMSFDDLNPMQGAIVKGGTQNKAMAQIQGGEGVFQLKGLQEMFGGFGTQNAYQRSFGLTSADAEMIGTAMASKISLKTGVTTGNMNIILDNTQSPIGGSDLTI